MGLDFWRDLGGLLAFAFGSILPVFGFIEFYRFLGIIILFDYIFLGLGLGRGLMIFYA